ncbi:hypothetical protein GC197_08435 [bacterium]|nr:hypothetical protein [bacterium]
MRHLAIHFAVLVILPLCLANELPGDELPKSTVQNIKVLPDKAPDCSSLKSIVDSVTRGCKTNDERAIAIYNFMRLTHYHRAYPSEPGGIPVLKEINCYGWSLCGGLHAEQSALWRAMGWEWRFVGWPGHTTVEVFYDGRWHYLDVFLKFYAWMPDPQNPSRRTIAGEADLAANPQELVFDAFEIDPSRRVAYAKGNAFELIGEKANWQAPAFLVCGDGLQGVVNGVQHRNRVGPSPGWGGMQHETGDYSAAVNLAPGFALTNTWDKAEGAWYWAGSKIEPCHTCGDKEIRNSPEKGPIAEPYLGPDWKAESYANGQIDFRPDLARPDCLNSFASLENIKQSGDNLVPAEPGKPARVIVQLQSPYILTQASGTAEGVDQFEVSIDDGKSWKKADLKDFGAIVGGQTKVLARLTFAKQLKTLRLQATVQNNPFALPFLSPGRNTVTVSVADPASLSDNKLVVTYAYRKGARRTSYEQMFLEGKEIARAHDASWETTPTVVQKTFSANELPATLTIDIPTPDDLYPVYPRMLFVRREIVAPGQKPLPIPKTAKPPEMKPGDALKTLPNPLLTGTQPPPKRPERPIKTRSISLTPGHFVSKSGEVQNGDFLKWPKTDRESIPALVYLIGDDLPELPPLKDIAAARLIVPLTRAHAKAPTKIGAVALRVTHKPGQPYNFANLGDTLSTTIIPTLADDAPSWAPPKEFILDVTRYIKSLQINHDKHHGFGLRVIPDRAVDDGWTVRVHLPENPSIRLEIDTYADKKK